MVPKTRPKSGLVELAKGLSSADIQTAEMKPGVYGALRVYKGEAGR